MEYFSEYRFSGKHGKGYRKAEKILRRKAAENRNAEAQPVTVLECGHIHGYHAKSFCSDLAEVTDGNA